MASKNKMLEEIDVEEQAAILRAIQSKKTTDYFPSSSSSGYSDAGSSSSSSSSNAIVHKNDSLLNPEWELIDPNPDVHALYIQWDARFFGSRLQACGVSVSWSPKMTSCAGICCYEGRSGMCSVRLSVPLLKLRPRSDLVNTLLHEMIHAYLFVTRNNRDRDGHGPEFKKHMERINNDGGTRITIYHTFHDEVKLYKTHWWHCNGPCQHQHPFYGWVKRAMNRAPGPYDSWWNDHKSRCNGTFIKVKEPEKKEKPKKVQKSQDELKQQPSKKSDSINSQGQSSESLKKSKKSSATASKKSHENGNQEIRSFVSTQPRSSSPSSKKPSSPIKLDSIAVSTSQPIVVAAFTGQGQTLGGNTTRSRLLDIPMSKFPPKRNYPF